MRYTGLEPNAPTTVNKNGGKQSATIYRCDLLDPVAMLSVSDVLSRGAEKYGADNWRNLSVNENLNHLLMHVFAYLSGDNADDHLSHAACRAIFALAVQLRPTYKGEVHENRTTTKQKQKMVLPHRKRKRTYTVSLRRLHKKNIRSKNR